MIAGKLYQFRVIPFWKKCRFCDCVKQSRQALFPFEEVCALQVERRKIIKQEVKFLEHILTTKEILMDKEKARA